MLHTGDIQFLCTSKKSFPIGGFLVSNKLNVYFSFLFLLGFLDQTSLVYIHSNITEYIFQKIGMFTLCQRYAPGFSVGGVLAPRGWTIDVASHYVIHSFPTTAATTGAPIANAGAVATSSDELPLGSSSNTARFECMLGEDEGSVLYITELFVPRESASTSELSAATPSPWDAERVRSLLLQSARGKRDAVTGDGDVARDRAECEAVWVAEVQNGSCVDLDEGGVGMQGDGTPSTSLYDTLHPFFHIFVEVVWDLGQAETRRAHEEAVQRIFLELERQYRTPALQLDAYRCFSQQHVEHRTVATSSSSNTSANTGAISINTSPASQLREPCAPAILANTQSSHVNPLWSAGLYSASGGAFVQLLAAPMSKEIGGFALQPLLTGARWNLMSGAVSQECGGAVQPAQSADCKATGTCSVDTTASALRRLLRDQLCLHWEALTVAIRTSDFVSDTTDELRGIASDVVVAVATLPLDSLPQLTSLYSFASVEAAWEAHVAGSMKRGQEARRVMNAEPGSGRDEVESWELQKLSSSLVPSLEEVSTALDEVEMAQTRMDDPRITSAERVMRYIEASTAPSPVLPRCSTYLLHLTSRGCRSASSALTENTEPILASADDMKDKTEEAYIVQLHGPRVQSRQAIVVCMRVPLSWTRMARDGSHQGEGGSSRSLYSGVAAQWASALGRSYRLAPFTPSLWLPRDVSHATMSGVCCRSGRLMVHIPAEDCAYANARLAPVASQAFTSLGSIAVWVHQGASATPFNTSLLRHGTAFDSVAAVWTLVGDGRSAAAYLEDALMEYMYDTNSKNLNNISQPSQHTQRAGVLVIRKRQRQRVRVVSTSGQAPGSALIGLHEICSAWVDVGETHRMLLRVRDVGVGEVLVTEASLACAHTEDKGKATASDAARVSRAEEEALEKWIEGIGASAMQKVFR